MTGNEIRETFLKYFERQGHTRVRSSPLLPANDPTLLFTNAGMNQFKDVFLGSEKRDYVRACSSQKCLRAGGKHNDLDEVGKTARHQTFFEMLGNFSFGDYFKEDAVKFAWDLLVNEYKLDPARMWFSVFEGDDQVGPDEEAEKFWEQVGAPRERILRFDRKDNFWQMGDTGPCGPCSEIHYYMGPDPADAENCAANVNGPGDTITEIWNLVFMQFDRSEVSPGEYKLEPLPAPSVDTGMGLERITTVLQGVKSNYETDLMRPIIEYIAGPEKADKTYEPDTQEGFAMRVIADHARATAFSIADGILPGNEGRNYVIRKIMRRAIYQGRHTLGLEGLFFSQVTNFVVDQMHRPYPELEAQRGFIEKMVKLEEERFGNTLTVGLSKLQELSERGGKTFQLEALARLKDTFGTPVDLMYVFLIEGNRYVTYEEQIDTNVIRTHVLRVEDLSAEEFSEYVERAIRGLQKQTGERASAAKEAISPTYVALSRRHDTKARFRGYESTTIDDARVVAIVEQGQQVQSLSVGADGEVLLDETPFYAEAGGQVGDTGVLRIDCAPAGGNSRLIEQVSQIVSLAGSARAIVTGTYSPAQGLIVHKVKVEKGSLKVGDTVSAEVDVEKRDATRRNHTATHLMHAALREVLGTHVKQAGSVVAPTYLRFDFNHYQPLTPTEVEEIENLVNYHILRNEPVKTNEMATEEAMRSGAMALFGEKYGEKVRVLSIKGAEDIFSRELCGGTHVRATGDIGLFKITSDESIASGVRRIRAVTGVDAFERFREAETILDRVATGLRTSRAELPTQVERLQDELKKARREADDLRMKIASGAISSAGNGDESREVAGVRVVAREASGLDSAGMRQLSDTLLARIKSGVVVLGRSSDGKVSLIVRTSDDLTGRVPAGKVIKELAPMVGGKGGGKADMAEGGGTQPDKLNEALEASYAIIERLVSSNSTGISEQKAVPIQSTSSVQDPDGLNLQFYESYDHSFLFKKAMTLLAAIKSEGEAEETESSMDAQEGMDKNAETLRAEIHFTEFHQFEALFALMLALFQDEPHWLYLTSYKTEEIKRKVRAFLDRNIADVTNNRIADMSDFVNWAIYTGYAASPPTELRAWQVNIDNLVWLLDRMATKYLEATEYNAYKHGLRTMQGPAKMAIIPDENPSAAFSMGAEDTISYLEVKGEKGRKIVYRTTKAFSLDESINHLLAMRRILETIRSTRLAKLRNEKNSHVLTFFELDKEKFHEIGTKLRWSFTV